MGTLRLLGTGLAARLAAIAFVAVLVVATLFAALERKFPFRGGDEQGHASYVAHLADTGVWWPDLADMPLYDGDAPTAARNFINHPPTFYLLSEPLYDAVRAIGADPAWLRAFPMALAFLAFAAIAALGLRARFGPLGFLGAGGALLFLDAPVFSAFFGNDQMATLGGALACLGALRRIEDRADDRALALLLIGVALCSVKLTALLLVGGCAAFALLGDPRKNLDLRGLAWLALVGAVASAPFAALWLQHGSPTPDTPGQTAMLRGYIAEFGWDRLPRVGLFEYVASVPSMFAVQLGQGFGTFLAFSLLCAVPFVAFMAPRTEGERAAAGLVRAAMIATLLMLVVHVAFAHRRYDAFGWLGDFYPRYYFPLLGAYCVGWALCVRRLADWASPLWMRALSAIRPQFS